MTYATTKATRAATHGHQTNCFFAGCSLAETCAEDAGISPCRWRFDFFIDRFQAVFQNRDALRQRIEREHAAASRQKIKRALLDQLDTKHKFDPPPTLVEEEFNNVWSTIENDLKQQGRTFADEGTTEEKARQEYRTIAERRVRLGLVLAEIGEKNNIKVTDDQLTQAIVAQARMMPGQEQGVWEYYRNNPAALAAVRAPLFEDKVIDFLLEIYNVTEKQVSREELFKEDED